MLPELSFQLDHNISKHSIVLEDAHILQEAKNRLSSLLEVEYNSIISKSPMDVRRTNLFQIDNPTVGPPVTCKPYPDPLEYQKFVNKEMKLLENAG